MAERRFIEQASNEGPLCPNIDTDYRHLLAVKVINAMYEVMDKDEDDESPADQQRIYDAAEGIFPMRMNLYLTTSSPLLALLVEMQGGGVYIESWYFKCPTCDLILPANTVNNHG